MLDFISISTRSKSKGIVEIYPKFIIKKSQTTNTEPIFSEHRYKSYCKLRDEVLNNIPITFDAHCSFEEPSDVYSFYDKNIENGIKKEKSFSLKNLTHSSFKFVPFV